MDSLGPLENVEFYFHYRVSMVYSQRQYTLALLYSKHLRGIIYWPRSVAWE